ncbi:MAG: hypothetical protein KKA42_03105 [candidate division Zixibacteria bacterium]|nr:hypothetical protein [candidate division Zixibacteria bacterium]
MRRSTLLLAVAVAVLAGGVALAADNSGRIYGKIYTVDGDEFEGLIRWDKNEGAWVDLLNGTKELSKRNLRQGKRELRKKYGEKKSSLKIFGIEVGGDNTYVSWGNSAESGVRFGHMKSLEVIDDDRILVTLKSGEEFELSNGSTDIGSSIREIVIEDDAEGEIEFSWDDLERIEFSAAKTDKQSNFGDRLYGKVSTRRGGDFEGFVAWDVDEIFTTDILDGDENRRSRKIRFGRIKAIERYSSSGAQVTLDDGTDMVLRGSNDVDSGNRGIIVSDPGFGQVTVPWDDFERVEFMPVPKRIDYKSFDGGRRLKGTVSTEDGEEYTGEIRWDNDEEYTWEKLDGENRNIEFDIEFGLIRSIEKRSYRAATVTVLDGREFQLRGSNDVDEDNKGIVIMMPDGDEVFVDWEDFARVVFTE